MTRNTGTRMAIEQSLQHHDGLSTDIGSSRQQHQLRADPNEVRRLQSGMCFALGSGQAQKLHIAAIPDTTSVSIFQPNPPATTETPGVAPPADDEPIRL